MKWISQPGRLDEITAKAEARLAIARDNVWLDEVAATRDTSPAYGNAAPTPDARTRPPTASSAATTPRHSQRGT
jgi:hypothetical protein